MKPPKPSPETVLRSYLHAKDENRPHLLKHVFAHDAELVISNKSASISFPALTHGREAIAEVLVRSFGMTYENVYSFYLAAPPSSVAEYTCNWLVAMSERASNQVRVGCGSYVWSFQSGAPFLAHRLAITIEVMQVLPAVQFEPVIVWLEALNYPWSSAASALQGLPAIPELSPIAQYLGRNGSVA
ncbi:MAG: hypothetical protein ABIS45_14875 [Burkholderiales bacterium]